jgi:molybdopterin/thiamine biosynthesis adenylyltransferase
MRNATILVITLKGTATETIKNIVLAGVGRLVVADPEPVSPEDLGAGFFFREEDIGKKVSLILLKSLSTDGMQEGRCRQIAYPESEPTRHN